MTSPTASAGGQRHRKTAEERRRRSAGRGSGKSTGDSAQRLVVKSGATDSGVIIYYRGSAEAPRRRLSARQKASSLYHLWHNLRDISAEAEQYNDSELVHLLAVVQILIEERMEGAVQPHDTLPSSRQSEAGIASDAYRPDARARALLRGVKLGEEDLKSSGGAYSLSEVQKLMRGITRQAVNNRVRDGSLLAVPGPSNRASYPVAQFMDDGMPVEGLREVREALGTDNSWMILNFLISAESKLAGKKPIDLLKAGELKQVLEVARRFGLQGA